MRYHRLNVVCKVFLSFVLYEDKAEFYEIIFSLSCFHYFPSSCNSLIPSFSVVYPSIHNSFHLSFLSHCIQQILESVHHCHVNGIVHRDLKVCMTKGIAANSDNMKQRTRFRNSCIFSNHASFWDLFPICWFF